MLPSLPDYLMTRHSSRRYGACGKCRHPVRPGRRYIIDAIDSSVIYHADCYRQLRNQANRSR
jgi:hypothetical protein